MAVELGVVLLSCDELVLEEKMHFPATQLAGPTAGLHFSPQEPQLETSVNKSTHDPKQRVSPTAQVEPGARDVVVFEVERALLGQVPAGVKLVT